jgi:hypothetical protein
MTPSLKSRAYQSAIVLRRFVYDLIFATAFFGLALWDTAIRGLDADEQEKGL